MKVIIPEVLIDYYTDIYSHCYEPNEDRLAIGTSTGKVLVMERDDKNEMQYVADAILPGEVAVLGLNWSSAGIFIGARSVLYLLKPEDIHQQVASVPYPFIRFEGGTVNDVCSQGPADRKVFGACDDSKVRVWDVETQQLICELTDQKTAVEVCNANNEYLVTGSQDGKVFIYDSDLRTKQPVNSFDVGGNHVIGGLDVSQNSTWVAAGWKGSPQIYNLRNTTMLQEIEVEKPEKICTVHFDGKNNLWWAGSGTVAYRSSSYTSVSSKLKTSFGSRPIHHLYSITSNQKSVSIAGSSTSILFTENGDYWEEMVSL